jgi:hypothetical protein
LQRKLGKKVTYKTSPYASAASASEEEMNKTESSQDGSRLAQLRKASSKPKPKRQEPEPEI